MCVCVYHQTDQVLIQISQQICVHQRNLQKQNRNSFAPVSLCQPIMHYLKLWILQKSDDS